MYPRLHVLLVLLLPLPIQPAAVRDYSKSIALETTSETSANVSMGDLDGDGDLDLVLAKGRHWPLANRVLLNDGRGTFVASDLAPTADRSYSTVLADGVDHPKCDGGGS